MIESFEYSVYLHKLKLLRYFFLRFVTFLLAKIVKIFSYKIHNIFTFCHYRSLCFKMYQLKNLKIKVQYGQYIRGIVRPLHGTSIGYPQGYSGHCASGL